MINMGELFDNDRIRDIPMERVLMSEREIKNYSVRENDLLFARQSILFSGAGKCSIVIEVPEITTFESHIIRVRLDQKKADPLYYYYYFKSPLSSMRSIIQQGVQAGVRASDLEELRVSYPPLPVQRRIAQVLGHYDVLIENYQRQISILEVSAQALYREWFVRGRVKNVGIEKRLGDIATETRRIVKAQDLEPSTPYVGLEHLSIKSIVIRDWGTAEDVDSDKLAFEKNEILFCKIRPYLHKVCLSHFAGVCSSDAIVMKPTIENALGFLLFTVFDEKFIEFADKISNGTKMPRAEWGVLKTYKLFVPDDAVLADFEKVVLPVLSKLENLQSQITLLRQMRDKLLPRLMSGQISLTTAA
jgi:type I restriction enzyme S subunit